MQLPATQQQRGHVVKGRSVRQQQQHLPIISQLPTPSCTPPQPPSPQHQTQRDHPSQEGLATLQHYSPWPRQSRLQRAGRTRPPSLLVACSPELSQAAAHSPLPPSPLSPHLPASTRAICGGLPPPPLSPLLPLPFPPTRPPTPPPLLRPTLPHRPPPAPLTPPLPPSFPPSHTHPANPTPAHSLSIPHRPSHRPPPSQPKPTPTLLPRAPLCPSSSSSKRPPTPPPPPLPPPPPSPSPLIPSPPTPTPPSPSSSPSPSPLRRQLALLTTENATLPPPAVPPHPPPLPPPLRHGGCPRRVP